MVKVFSKLRPYLIFIAPILTFGSCGILKDSPKYQLANGYYKSTSFSKKAAKVYVDNGEDTIFIYSIDKVTKLVDTTKPKIVFPAKNNIAINNSKVFRKPSFDVDFVTIPFKYRPIQSSFPQQFNANLNGAIYFGFRSDVYQVKYKYDLFRHQRRVTHYGLSFGVFTGLGSTAINPWVTKNGINYEYEGVAWSKGIGAIIGINNFTLGLALGFDDLLDKNKDFWIYQRTPWLGLVFGLNLN